MSKKTGTHPFNPDDFGRFFEWTDVPVSRPFLPTAWAFTVSTASGSRDKKKGVPAEEGFGKLIGSSALFTFPALFALGSLIGFKKSPLTGTRLENAIASGVKTIGITASVLIPPTAAGYALGRLLTDNKSSMRKQASGIWEKGSITALLTGLAVAAARIEKQKNPNASIPQAYWNIYKYVAPASALAGGAVGYKIWQGSPKATLLGALTGLLMGGILSGTALPAYFA